MEPLKNVFSKLLAMATDMALIAVVLALGFGWCINVIKLARMDVFMTGMGVARIAGIFVLPLGCVLGYL